MINVGKFEIIVSEKSNKEIQNNKYTFIVERVVNKVVFKQYLKQKYGVDVVAVNSANLKGKARRRGRITGRTPSFKKLVVTLKQGQEIKEFKEIF